MQALKSTIRSPAFGASLGHDDGASRIHGNTVPNGNLLVAGGIATTSGLFSTGNLLLTLLSAANHTSH